MKREMFRQTKSGMWHLVYMNRTNCNRYNDANWKSLDYDLSKVVKSREELPANAKICKKCFTSNQ